MINKIKTISVSEYPRLFHFLNIWIFPDELKEFEPKNWNLLQMPVKFEYLLQACEYIKSIIGEKECLRYLHTKSNSLSNGNRSDDEFEEWYANREPLSKEALKLLKNPW